MENSSVTPLSMGKGLDWAAPFLNWMTTGEVIMNEGQIKPVHTSGLWPIYTYVRDLVRLFGMYNNNRIFLISVSRANSSHGTQGRLPQTASFRPRTWKQYSVQTLNAGNPYLLLETTDLLSFLLVRCWCLPGHGLQWKLLMLDLYRSQEFSCVHAQRIVLLRHSHMSRHVRNSRFGYFQTSHYKGYMQHVKWRKCQCMA